MEVRRKAYNGNFTCAPDATGGGPGGPAVNFMECQGTDKLSGFDDATGFFTCATDETAVPGAGDDLGNHKATGVLTTWDILPDMNDSTPMGGASGGGGPSIVSKMDIGSSTQYFSNLYVEDMHLGDDSLWMGAGDDKFKVLTSDPGVRMNLFADEEQEMSIQTKGADLRMELVNPGIQIPDKNIVILNESANGKIILDSKVALGGAPEILFDSPTVTATGALGVAEKVTAKNVQVLNNIMASGQITSLATISAAANITYGGKLIHSGVDVYGVPNGDACDGGDAVIGFTDGVFTCGTVSGSTGGTSLWTEKSPNTGIYMGLNPDLTLESASNLNLQIPSSGTAGSNINITNAANDGKIVLGAPANTLNGITLDTPIVLATGAIQATSNIVTGGNFKSMGDLLLGNATTGSLGNSNVRYWGDLIRNSVPVYAVENQDCAGKAMTAVTEGVFTCDPVVCDDLEYSQCAIHITTNPVGFGLDLMWFDSCGNMTTEKEDCGDLGCLMGEVNGACYTAPVCTNYASSMCWNLVQAGTNDVHWLDSCGQPQGLKEDCGTNGCTDGPNGTASCNTPPVCDENAYHQCDADGHLYWYDSCNNKGDMKLACADGCTGSTGTTDSLAICNDPGPYEWDTGPWGPCGEKYRVEDVFVSLGIDTQEIDNMLLYYTSGDGSSLETAPDEIASLNALQGVIATDAKKLYQVMYEAASVTKVLTYSSQEADLNSDGTLSAATGSQAFTQKAQKQIPLQLRDVFCINKYGAKTAAAFCKDEGTKPESSEDCTITPTTYEWSVGPWSACGSLSSAIATKNNEEVMKDLASVAVSHLGVAVAAAAAIEAPDGTPTITGAPTPPASLGAPTYYQLLKQIHLLWLAQQQGDKATVVDLSTTNGGGTGGGYTYPSSNDFNTDFADYVATDGTVLPEANKSVLPYQTRDVLCGAKSGTAMSEDFCLNLKPFTTRTCAPVKTNIEWMIGGWSACSGPTDTRTRSVVCSWCTEELCVIGGEGENADDAICPTPKPADSEVCNGFVVTPPGNESPFVNGMNFGTTQVTIQDTILDLATQVTNLSGTVNTLQTTINNMGSSTSTP